MMENNGVLPVIKIVANKRVWHTRTVGFAEGKGEM